MKITKKLLYVTLALVLALSSISSAFACTGIYVGSEVSANGSTWDDLKITVTCTARCSA